MTPLKRWFALAAGFALVFATGCSRHADHEAANANAVPARLEDADVFVASANDQLEVDATAMHSALMAPRTASDAATQKIVTDAEARHLALLDRLIEESSRYDGQTLKPETARAIERLRLLSETPMPHDPAKISELAAIASRMRMIDRVESYCKRNDAASCRSLDELDEMLLRSRDFDERLDAWTLRHSNTAAMRKDYARFVGLANDGAKRLGFANAGEYQRARYDLDADELRSQTDRLWSQIKPLYYQLQCYTRVRLANHYGERAQADGMIRAHLVAGFEYAVWYYHMHMDLLAPYPNATRPETDSSWKPDAALELLSRANESRSFLLRLRYGDPLPQALFRFSDVLPLQTSHDPQAVINTQMRSALDFFAWLAFTMASEHWRWGVSDGSIKPGDYNKAWWAMRAKYEGIAPPSPRDERSFDAGTSDAIAANQPQSGDFLAGFLAFQIDRALCKSANGKGPSFGCDLNHDPAASKLYHAMLARGASQPWPKALKELTGEESIDAGALLEYFAPLRAWLERQNKGAQCGWEGNFASSPSTTAAIEPTTN